MSTAIKRKRGLNYTPQEVKKLMDLVNQHKSAVDDKRTGTIFLSRKNEAWEKICTAYNAVATSGNRTKDQLKVLYDNKKQKARKSLAESNGQWNKTGGVSGHDQKILDLIKYQVSSLSNSCDSAAELSGDFTQDNIESEGTNVELMEYKDCTILDNEGSIIRGNTESSLITPEQAKVPKNKKHVITPRLSNKVKRKLVNYKNHYFKRKSQNAYLERRKIYQDIRLRQKEHSMAVKEHNLKIAIMQKEHEARMKNISMLLVQSISYV